MGPSMKMTISTLQFYSGRSLVLGARYFNPHKRLKTSLGQNHSWTPEEARDLPGWFEQHRNLSEKEIKEQLGELTQLVRSRRRVESQAFHSKFWYHYSMLIFRYK
jgi:hypothetical protein